VPERWKGKPVTAVPGDLREPGSVDSGLEGAEVVYHIGEVRNTTAGRSNLNVAFVEHLAGALKPAGVKRLVFVSSISVAGIPLAIPATEDTPASQVLRDQYTEYKRKAEDIIRQSAGAEHAIIRPGVVYGPGSRFLVRMVDAIRRFGPLGLPFIGNGKNLAPLVHVHDLARAIVLAGARPGALNRTFNITDGERHTWFDLFSAIAEAQRRRVRIIPVHPALARFPAMFMDLFTGLFGQSLELPAMVNYLSRDVHFDVSRAKAALGWVPAHRDLRDAVREMVAWYEKRKDQTR
jgi:nucleoside-diphosphate-sugar epimerase